MSIYTDFIAQTAARFMAAKIAAGLEPGNTEGFNDHVICAAVDLADELVGQGLLHKGVDEYHAS